MTTAATQRYSLGAIIFHWVIAIAVIVNWRLVESAEGLPDAQAGELMGIHKALGIAILLLTLGRLVWRMSHKPPAPPQGLANWEKLLAKGTHLIFYLLLIGLPIGGWLAGSFAGKPVDFFGLFALPMAPVEQNFDAAGAIIGFHSTGGEVMIILIGLHILGAMKHSFLDKVPSFSRMWPGGR